MTDLKATKILVPGSINPDTFETLKATFDVRHLPSRNIADLPEEERPAILGVAGFNNVPAKLMDALPNLEIVANFGVGYDGVDANHAASKGIMVTNTPDVLTEEVADTALGLTLMTLRDLGRAEQYLRAGRWESDGPFPLTQTTLRGRTAGIMGLGRIGLAIATRLEAFGVRVAYHNRTKRDDVAYAYHDTLKSLAEAVDLLVIAAPGGASTDKAVDAEVLKALGPKGVLINIGRGTTVDEEALIVALKDGTIQAAGLDVFEKEPKVPQGLLDAPNAVLLPHVASASRHTRKAMGDLLVENLKLWFSGQDVVTPVAEVTRTGLKRRG
ncbi:2-hydroxyacid dehydrogenase [Aureimonas mangrovi]|uniref:2-hydroxyacid dehydrogenase n=1 Tax=Aureimonas mangrovi TaxID=2758041 RepID=UPI00163D5954|nr:2-hydroxyacid dehydrogenase [Aureimonas mangrovi]